ncbi:MAG: hypothetical protein QM778_30375 [Myxococcales bacterium]
MIRSGSLRVLGGLASVVGLTACDTAPHETSDAGPHDAAGLELDATLADATSSDENADASPHEGLPDAAELDAARDAATDVGEDPGREPWRPVPANEVRETCRLDPEQLVAADQALGVPWAVVRYGKLCHQFGSQDEQPGHVFSVTKTLGALVTGMVAHETRSLARTTRKTGPLSDEDRIDHWLDDFAYNPSARVGHVLAMVAHSEGLGSAPDDMVYDSFGTTQINSLSDVLNAAIRQDSVRLAGDLDGFTQRFLFDTLGLEDSEWAAGQPDKTFGWSWVTSVRDMARVGLLLLRQGSWQGERLLSPDWIARMTHPAFEIANTGYGYLTWVNSASNFDFGGADGPVLQDASGPMLTCAPVSLHGRYPHGLSTAQDCHYAAPYPCTQTYDVGVWQAVGLGGQVIQGHPGLDLLLVARDLTPLGGGQDAPILLWEAVRDAVVAADPTYQGDLEAFCAAYGANDYAPDLAR